MKRVVLSAVLLVAATAFGAGAATASHTSVSAAIYMGFDSAENILHEGSAACTNAGPSTTCSVTVDLGGRDYGRFKRACGYTNTTDTSATAVISPSSNSSPNQFCTGARNFQIRWFVSTTTANDHENAIYVNLVVTR